MSAEAKVSILFIFSKKSFYVYATLETLKIFGWSDENHNVSKLVAKCYSRLFSFSPEIFSGPYQFCPSCRPKRTSPFYSFYQKNRSIKYDMHEWLMLTMNNEKIRLVLDFTSISPLFSLQRKVSSFFFRFYLSCPLRRKFLYLPSCQKNHSSVKEVKNWWGPETNEHVFIQNWDASPSSSGMCLLLV